METTIETTWKQIETKDLTKGMFIVVGWYNYNAKKRHSLYKVIKKNKNSFTIKEIATSTHDMRENEIFHRFPIFNSTRIEKISKDGNFHELRKVTGIFEVDPEIVKAIGENTISKEDEKITKLMEELSKIKKEKRKHTKRVKNLDLA